MGSCLSRYCDSGAECHRETWRKKGGRLQEAMEILTAEARSSELLLRVPGRMCCNGASAMANTFTQQGRKGTNQDAMLVWESFTSREDTIFCGVFDGHGPYGHLVSRKVRDSLPSKIASQWKARMRGDEGISSTVESSQEEEEEEEEEEEVDEEENVGWKEETEGGGESETVHAWKQSFLKSFSTMDKELRTHPTIDCFCSGTTAVTLLLQGQDLVIGNVGDSRAILGTRGADNSLMAVQLTVDLKPNLPKEAERIKKCKGRVFSLQDEPTVARVWLPYDDSPGLAMARAFGDFCLKDFGLIAVPKITHRRVSDNDEFIVLATDGVWDVLSNEEAVEAISTAPTRGSAARALVETAIRAWRVKYPTSKIDDCAAICLYLHPAQEDQENSVLSQEGFRNGPRNDKDKVEASLSESASTERDDDDCVTEVDRSNTTQSSINNEISTEKSTKINTEIIELAPDDETSPKKAAIDRSSSHRSLADCFSVTDNEDWSALEGVTRVNSLISLPRSGVNNKAGGMKRRR